LELVTPYYVLSFTVGSLGRYVILLSRLLMQWLFVGLYLDGFGRVVTLVHLGIVQKLIHCQYLIKLKFTEFISF